MLTLCFSPKVPAEKKLLLRKQIFFTYNFIARLLAYYEKKTILIKKIIYMGAEVEYFILDSKVWVCLVKINKYFFCELIRYL